MATAATMSSMTEGGRSPIFVVDLARSTERTCNAFAPDSRLKPLSLSGRILIIQGELWFPCREGDYYSQSDFLKAVGTDDGGETS